MPLTDRGLILRYYVDEAASGTTPTQVLDSSGIGTAVPWNITYNASNLVYDEVAGNRCLRSLTNGTGAGRLRADVGTTKLAGLNGKTKATVVVVVEASAFNTSNSRIFCINDKAGGSPQIGLAAPSATQWQIHINNTTAAGNWVYNLGTARMILHIVYDTTQAVATDRCKLYKDGVLQTPASTNLLPAQNATFAVASTDELVSLGRESAGAWGDRAWTGRLYYGALHEDVAFTQAEVDADVAVLATDDDAPAAGSLVHDSGWLTADLLSHVVAGLAPGNYTATVQHRDQALLASAESAPFAFTVTAQSQTFPVSVGGTMAAAHLSGQAQLQVRVLRAGTMAAGDLSGGLVKRAGLARGGTMAVGDLAGALAKRLGLSRAGTMAAGDMSGTLTDRKVSMVSIGSTMAAAHISGALATAKALLRSVGSTMLAADISGGLAKRIGKGTGGTMLASQIGGALAKQVGKALASTQSAISGTVTNAKVAIVTLAGTLSAANMAGALERRVGKLLAGSTQPTGTLTKQQAVATGGTVTSGQMGGTITQRLVKLIDVGSTLASPSGTLTADLRKALAGTLATISGGLTRALGLSRGSTMTATQLTGSLTAGKQVQQALGSTVAAGDLSGAVSQRVALGLGSSMAPTGALGLRLAISLGGTLAPRGTVVVTTSADLTLPLYYDQAEFQPDTVASVWIEAAADTYRTAITVSPEP